MFEKIYLVLNIYDDKHVNLFRRLNDLHCRISYRFDLSALWMFRQVKRLTVTRTFDRERFCVKLGDFDFLADDVWVGGEQEKKLIEETVKKSIQVSRLSFDLVFL